LCVLGVGVVHVQVQMIHGWRHAVYHKWYGTGTECSGNETICSWTAKL